MMGIPLSSGNQLMSPFQPWKAGSPLRSGTAKYIFFYRPYS
jgi:hypothetical protein